jgi:GNAT superfamily N-acetyltransferase
MDMRDRADVDRWLALLNEAFGRRWGRDQFREAVLEHPHYEIRRTFFLCDPRGVVGMSSIGVFRRNQSVGLSHYVAIAPRSQGRGLGTQLARYRFREILALGVARSESETQISRSGGIRTAMSCGFEPKYELDHWNTPDESPALVRAITRRRLERLYRLWQAEQGRPARRASAC